MPTIARAQPGQTIKTLARTSRRRAIARSLNIRSEARKKPRNFHKFCMGTRIWLSRFSERPKKFKLWRNALNKPNCNGRAPLRKKSWDRCKVSDLYAVLVAGRAVVKVDRTLFSQRMILSLTSPHISIALWRYCRAQTNRWSKHTYYRPRKDSSQQVRRTGRRALFTRRSSKSRPSSEWNESKVCKKLQQTSPRC